MWMYLVAFLGALVVSISAQNPSVSPCPELFQYVSHQPGQWDGDLTLFSDSDLHGVWVRLIFDGPSKEITVADNFGEIRAKDDPEEYLLHNRNYILKAGEPVKVRISAKYEGNKAPKLIGFRLNAKTVCPQHGGVYNWVEGSAQSSNEFFLGDLNNKDFLASRPAAGSFTGCGTVPLFPGALSTGKKTSEGQWPWQASIYLTSGDKKKICEATLISPTHLVTAAHCVTPKNSGSTLNPDTLTIRLGEHFAKSENKGLQEGHVLNIALHPGYNPINFDNDVAIIRLDKAITISDFVRPVCLWEESTDVQSILRRQGVVVGLGFDNNGHYTDRLTHAQLKVVAPDVCSNSKPELAPFLTGKSLCAGYGKGNTVCVGESGSGFSFLREGEKPVWQLRGLVSVGAGLQNKLVCDESNYIVITDLARHLKWIQGLLA